MCHLLAYVIMTVACATVDKIELDNVLIMCLLSIKCVVVGRRGVLSALLYFTTWPHARKPPQLRATAQHSL